MAIKLDLNNQLKKDSSHSSAIKKSKKKQSPPTTDTPAKKTLGRPKGEPTVARSIRIKQDIYDRLVDKQKETHIPFNELMNMALDAYLK